jgi:autotransporter-associated beta strand protein
MKSKLILPLINLLSALAATSVLGQVTYTWSGTLSGGNGTNIATPANWTTNEAGVPPPPAASAPSGTSQDTGQWDNLVPGNLRVTYNSGLVGTGGGTLGIIFALTANQIGSVQLAPVGGATGNIGFFGITDDSANGAVIMGDQSANVLNFVGRPGGAVHDLLNNSASPCVINSNVRWQAGAGAVYTLDFDGTGNWNVTNNLANANNTGMLIEKSGSGTMYWNGPSAAGAVPNSTINSPITLTAGTMVLQWNDTLINNTTIINNGALQFNGPGLSQTLSGAISGVGTNEVGGGTFILNGENTITGPDILLGGEMVVDSPETNGVTGPLGVGGTITFSGGTLGFSAVNTYDYSPRFDTSANQQYSFDTAGQIVTFTNNLTSSGGTLAKYGAGTLTLAGANTYSGLTAVGFGRLNIQGSAGTGNINVSNGATLGVFEGGAQIQPTKLTVGTSSGANLEFNSVNNTTTAPLLAGTVSAAAPITMNISGTFNTLGASYPLLSWAGGSPPPVTIGTVIGAVGTLSTNGNSILMTVNGLAYIWSGLNNGNWDTNTLNNWKLNGSASTFANGGQALFDDTATGTTNVALNATVTPGTVIINNSHLIYSIASSGTNLIGGAGSLTKVGTSQAILSGGVNTYSGATAVNGGILTVSTLANGGSASDIGSSPNSAASLLLNGGTLQYTGSVVSIDRLFTIGTGGATLDDEGSTLTLNNTGAIGLSGLGARTLTLTGTDASGDTIAGTLGDNGGSSAVTKIGTGTWILTGLNTYSGVTTISAGTLQFGNGGNSTVGSGSIVDNGGLVLSTSNTNTLGVVTGTGALTNNSGTVILPGNNSYSGGTVINAGTLQLGTGGASGQLNNSAPILDNGLLIFDSTGTMAFGQATIISGTGNLIVEGNGGLFKAIGANTYTGWTLINPGATLQPCEGNQGALVSSVVTNNGTLKFVNQDNGRFVYAGDIVGTGSVVHDLNNPNPGDATLTGTNTYSGGTFINGGGIIIGNNTTVGAGSIIGNVSMTSNTLQQATSLIEFNRPDTYTFPYIISGSGSLVDNGSGLLILTGNNTYTNGTTTINTTNNAGSASVLQVGNGGTTGSISVDFVTDNGTLVFDRSDNINIFNFISGTGAVAQAGSGVMTLSDTNTYTGATIVDSGTLIISGAYAPSGTAVGGDLDAYGGTLISGGTSAVVSNSVAGNLNISNATLVVNVNKSLTQSNTLYVTTNSITVTTGGALSVVNLGPAIHAGDSFTVFSKAVANGSLLTVTGSGVTWQNNLAASGTITALTSQKVPPTFSHISVSGPTLTISATNGVPNGRYVLLGTTNLTSGIWIPIFTNTFDVNGNISNLSTNIVNSHVPYEFYLLSQ